jgi:hypothetical protein
MTKETTDFIQAMRAFMAHRNLKKKDLKDALGISYETLEKKFRDPRYFDGHDREILSNVLDLPMEIVDQLVNNNLNYQDALIINRYKVSLMDALADL